MHRTPLVERCDSLPDSDARYDGFIAAVGYESRSRHVAERCIAPAAFKAACGFASRKVLSYHENIAWYRSAGYEVIETPDSGYARWLDDLLCRLCGNRTDTVTLCVDVSSTSRLRLALLIERLMTADVACDFCVDFLYSFARYGSGIEETVVTKAGPVTEMFAGWAGDPDVPLAAVFGLGYERDKALGVLEFLEPAEVWAFQPTSNEAKYGELIREANTSFYAGLSPRHILEYPVKYPFDSFRQVESFVYGIMQRSRVILLPFGPKLFALASLLVASIHYPRVSVWRVSGEDSVAADDRVPTGEIVRLRATFNQRDI
jgi:hypothetical protein